MRKIGIIAVLSLMALAIAAVPALADSPHFIKSGSSVNSAGQLVVTFKEAGLGTTATTEQITVSAQGTATYACINGGGNHPQAANKETVSQLLTNTGTFPVRNGQTTGSLTLGPASPGDFSCPPGQTFVLASVSYTNITITGSAGDSTTAPDVSRTFVNI
jgi:hypothetical protein